MSELKSRASLGLRYYGTAREKKGEYEKRKQEGVPGSKEGSIEPPGTRRETLHGETLRGMYTEALLSGKSFDEIEADEERLNA